MTNFSFIQFVTNDNSVVLPQPPQDKHDPLYGEIYRKFMGHLRHVPVSRIEIKILSAIQFTADISDLSDAIVSKMLIEMGLRASRLAFPTEFLDYADGALMRAGWSVGAPGAELLALQKLWFGMRKDHHIEGFRHVRAILEEEFADA